MNPSVAVRIFRGVQPQVQVDPSDRGLAYGDGLFETLRAHRGELPWWSAHWARLASGAARLRIPLPEEAFVHAQARELLAGTNAAVLKLLLTRGAGGRGYAPPALCEPMWMLSRHALPAAPEQGVAVKWCDTRLATQPLLAGLKHCNRLEQVLARLECADAGVDDGLMCDQEEFVTCATAGNVFALRDGVWQTPIIDRCGVQGVMRQWLLDHLDGVQAVRLSREDVESADALFLCNAVRGILPVRRLDDRLWPVVPALAAVTRQVAASAPMFAACNQE